MNAWVKPGLLKQKEFTIPDQPILLGVSDHSWISTGFDKRERNFLEQCFWHGGSEDILKAARATSKRVGHY